MGKDQIGVLIIESDTVPQSQTAQFLQPHPLVSFLKIAKDTDDVLLKIIDFCPDLIFMEYPLKGNTGTKIIRFIQSKLPQTTIAFISESKKYAVEAIHHEIYDYLVKPIVRTELERILEKVQIKKQSNSLTRINELIEKKKEETRLRFITARGFTIVNPDEIIYCKADGTYTELYFANKTTELTNLILSKMEEILIPYNFMRISRSIIINKNYIRKFYLKANKLLLSANGKEYEIKGARSSIRDLRKLYLE